MPGITVVAGGDDGGEAAHLAGAGKEVHAVADLGLAKGGGVLNGYGNAHARGVRPGNIGIHAVPAVDAGRGFDRRPVPLHPGPLHPGGRNAVLVAPDRKTIRVGVVGGIGPHRCLELGASQQAQQESGAEDCDGAADTPDGPSIHGTVVAQRSRKWTS